MQATYLKVRHIRHQYATTKLTNVGMPFSCFIGGTSFLFIEEKEQF